MERNPRWEVGFDRARDDINGWPLSGHDQVNTRGTGHLCQSLDTSLNLFSGDHHQICHLVDDDDDIGQFFWLEGFGFEDRITRCVIKAGLDRAFKVFAFVQSVLNAAVIARNVSNAHFGHLAVAFFHFTNDPFQRDHRLLRIGDYG